jgi:hypothetical protein
MSPDTVMTTSALVLLVAVPPCLVLLLASFRVFDQLLRVQYSKAYAEWQSYECPSGYFWKPPGSRQLSLKQRGSLWSHWYWYRPSWVESSKDSRQLYRRFRILGHLSIATFVPVFGSSCLLLTLAFIRSICACRGTHL